MNDFDRIVTVLTAESGLVSAFADGALRLKNKNTAATGLLCYSQLTFYKGRDTYKINEASTINVFFNLRKDIEKMSLAQYFCELSLFLAPEEENAERFLKLVLNALHLLCEDLRPQLLIKSAVELRMLSLAGYLPNLLGCRECGEFNESGFFFDTHSGNLICGECGKTGLGDILPPGVLAAMRHITYSDFNKLFSFSLPENQLKMLSNTCEKYLASRTERDFKTLKFYKSLLMNEI